MVAINVICKQHLFVRGIWTILCLSMTAVVGNNTRAQEEPAQHVGIERVFPRLRFHRPVFLAGANDGSARVFVTEQDGLVHVFAPGD